MAVIYQVFSVFCARGMQQALRRVILPNVLGSPEISLSELILIVSSWLH